ncbi:MAG TPA: PIG-L family deacetylase [Bryobacteraceae bacterium]|nr:PIG-L family deacetylase [Bryobacteraceae bacterium]
MIIRRTLQICVSLFFLAGLFYAAFSRAAEQQPEVNATAIAPDSGAAGLSHLLRQLQTRASLLMITAHPDDEDGGMLAYETRGEGVRAALLTLTRGEGGQNVMSGDLYDALGLVRTQELLIADRYMAVDQYFSRAVDYGFSKTLEEATQKWTHDRVLSDAVRVVRMFHPLVVTSVFVGAPTDGHGHHQMAGETAQEVYLAAGDPKMFPEQIREGLKPWSPLKVYARVPAFQITKEGMYDYAIDKFVPVRFFDYVNKTWSTTRPSTTLEIQEGVADPENGLTYLQIAREGLGYQRSQNGGGAIPLPSSFASAYHRYGSRIPAKEQENSFFDGIDVSLNGIADLAKGDTKFLSVGLEEISRNATEALKQYSADRPWSIAPLIAEGLKNDRALIERVKSSTLEGKDDALFELEVKERQFEEALAAALEISLQTTVAEPIPARGPGRQSATDAAFSAGRGAFLGRGGGPTFTIAIPGQSFDVEAQVFDQSPEKVAVESMQVQPSDGKNWSIHGDAAPREIEGNHEAQWRSSVTVPEDAALTRPYYSRPNEEQPYYDVRDERYRNLPTAPYPLSVRARLAYRGVPFEVAQVVQTNERVPGIGIVRNPLIVGPAISVSVSPPAGAVPFGTKSFQLACLVHSNVKGPAQGAVHLDLRRRGWRSEPAEAQFAFARDGEDKTIVFTVEPARSVVDDSRPVTRHTITAVAEYNGHEYKEGYHLTGYPGLRPYPYYRPATYTAVDVDVKLPPHLSIGYLPGTGDDVAQALENLGANVRILAASDITNGNLSGFDAIVLGTRAYAVRGELKTANSRLMDYVRNGGALIVQYQLQDFDREYGPYPFTLGGNPQKVVDEGSEVTILDPSSAAFAWPNKITAADFKGWVEERGHGFLREWDSRYTPLVETHDPDQDPQKGGLLLARYGKGFYVYDAFALYRQLPSGVPGAYRILANLVSLGKNPEWK